MVTINIDTQVHIFKSIHTLLMKGLIMIFYYYFLQLSCISWNILLFGDLTNNIYYIDN